ncbi:hypothetical protein ACIBG4_11895 [Nonomuraea sp. NPDC050383]
MNNDLQVRVELNLERTEDELGQMNRIRQCVTAEFCSRLTSPR